MTERSRGAPDPDEPSHSADRPAATWADGLRADLGAVRRTDAIIEALAERRAAPSERGRPAGAGSDPAVRLLHALIADVDEPVLRRVHTEAEGSAEPVAAGAETAGAEPGQRRRSHRTIVALGVAGVVLASTGVAAAGGGLTEASAPAPQAAEANPGDARKRGDAEPSLTTQPRERAAERPPADPRADRPVPRLPTPRDPAREQLDDLRDRLEGLLPPQPRPRKPGRPAWPTSPSKGQPQGKDPVDDTRRRLDEIRRRAEERIERNRGW